MTPTELQEILQNDEKLSVKQVKEIIWELKQDCFEEIYKLSKQRKEYETLKPKEKSVENIHKLIAPYLEQRFYNGETNAFYICLDLLEKVKEDE